MCYTHQASQNLIGAGNAHTSNASAPTNRPIMMMIQDIICKRNKIQVLNLVIHSNKILRFLCHVCSIGNYLCNGYLNELSFGKEIGIELMFDVTCIFMTDSKVVIIFNHF